MTERIQVFDKKERMENIGVRRGLVNKADCFTALELGCVPGSRGEWPNVFERAFTFE